MAYMTNPGEGTRELWDNDLLIPQIANYYDWGRLQMDSQFFAVMTNFGLADAINNTEVEIVGTAEYTNRLSVASGQTILIPAINSESAAYINFDTVSGTTGYRGIYQVGDAFYVRGDADGTEANRTDGDQVEAIVRISDVDSSGDYKLTTLWVTKDSASAYAAATLDTNTTLLNTKIDDFDGDAPDIELLRPDIGYNYMQMFRVPFGTGFVEKSQKHKYDNSMAYQGQISQDKIMMQINRALLFSTFGRNAASTATRETSSGLADGGTGLDYGHMKGLAGFLGANALGSSDVISQIDTGSSVDFWNLRDWATGFTVGGMIKYAVCAPSFANDIARAAYDAGFRQVEGSIQFPRFEFKYKEYDLGVIRLRIIVDRNLEWMSPVVYDGTNYAAAKKFLFAVDPQYFKIHFHNNDELGIMAPSLYKINTTNNSHKDKREWKAALTCALRKPQAHGIYGVTGS